MRYACCMPRKSGWSFSSEVVLLVIHVWPGACRRRFCQMCLLRWTGCTRRCSSTAATLALRLRRDSMTLSSSLTATMGERTGASHSRHQAEYMRQQAVLRQAASLSHS